MLMLDTLTSYDLLTVKYVKSTFVRQATLKSHFYDSFLVY